jgi:short-subunit dehydrogenase
MSGHRVINSKATSFYSATKHAVTALTEGLRQELREIKSGIRVTGISPGLVRTEFGPRLEKAADVEQAKKDYDKKVNGVRRINLS